MKAMPVSLPIRSSLRHVTLPLLALALVVACGGDEQPAPASPKPVATEAPSEPGTVAKAGPKTLEPGQAGRVTGRVSHAGASSATPIDVTGDAYCIGAAGEAGGYVDGSLVVHDGGLVNAFVYVDVDEDAWAFPEASGEVEIDQVGCLYTPRVVGVRQKQDLAFVNSDDTLHNIHTSGLNKEQNIATIKGARKTVSFKKTEVMAKVACDVHPWMRGWIGVMSHPCFAVTDGEGRFQIGDVPPGEHTLTVWHETLGTRELKITVGAGASVQADLSF